MNTDKYWQTHATLSAFWNVNFHNKVTTTHNRHVATLPCEMIT